MQLDPNEARLLPILEAIRLDPPSGFSLCGQHVEGEADYARIPPLGEGSPTLASTLQAGLYHLCYSRPFRADATWPAWEGHIDESLIERLSSANAGRDRWDAGWLVTSVHAASGIAVAQKFGHSRSFTAGYLLAEGGGAPTAGAMASVFYPHESRTLQPGFYLIYGETAPPDEHPGNFVRLYWSVDPQGAVALTALVTARLNRFEVPFRMKCLTVEKAYDRIDAAVVYVPRRYVNFALRILHDVPGALAKHLKGTAPLFTRQLWPGVGLAEDPGTGESFGSHRCRLLAEAVLEAAGKGFQDTPARLDEVRAGFARNGLDLARSHLSTSRVDWYALPQ